MVTGYACNVEEILGVSTRNAMAELLLRLPNTRRAPGRGLWLRDCVDLV